MVVLGGATLLFGISLCKILFSGAVPIAPESAPDSDAGSLRNWFPGHLAAGCVLGGAIAVLMEPVRQIGSRSMYAELRVAGANRELVANISMKIGMLESAVSLTTLLGVVAGAIYGDRLSGKCWNGHVVFLFPALAAGPALAHYLDSTHFSLTVGLAAVVYGAAVGLFGSNLFAAVLDVTAAGNWAKAIALLAAVQSVAPLSLSYAVSTPLLLPVSGWTACLYMI